MIVLKALPGDTVRLPLLNTFGYVISVKVQSEAIVLYEVQNIIDGDVYEAYFVSQNVEESEREIVCLKNAKKAKSQNLNHTSKPRDDTQSAERSTGL